MNSAQNKRLPRTETITVTLLVRGAKDHVKTFYSKAAAKEYFLKWHESVCAYPLVMVGGRELPTITAVRRYFGKKYARRKSEATATTRSSAVGSAMESPAG